MSGPVYSGNSKQAKGGGKQDWETPPSLFRVLNKEFGFTVDAAAVESNSLCEKYFEDGLRASWRGERVWCNPPYRWAARWVKKASAGEAAASVLLVPGSYDTRWWQNHVIGRAAEVRFIMGRVTFFQDGQISDRAYPGGLVLLVYELGLRPSAPVVRWVNGLDIGCVENARHMKKGRTKTGTEDVRWTGIREVVSPSSTIGTGRHGKTSAHRGSSVRC